VIEKYYGHDPQRKIFGWWWAGLGLGQFYWEEGEIWNGFPGGTYART
jgi:hypothetical protein